MQTQNDTARVVVIHEAEGYRWELQVEDGVVVDGSGQYFPTQALAEQDAMGIQL